MHIDEKDQPPVGVGDDITAKSRTNRGRHQRRNTQETCGQTTLMHREFSEKQSDREGEERGTANSLNHSKENQHRQIPGETAQRGSQSKQSKRDEIEALCAQTARKKSRRRRHHPLSKDIGGHYPLKVVEISRKSMLQTGQSIVNHRHVESTHKSAKRHDYDD